MSKPNAGQEIPLVDLKAQYETIKPQIDRALKEVLDSQYFVLGPRVEAFEREFAAYLGVKDFVCLSSGTAAVQLALQALGVGPGDEVITTPLTFFATVEGILLAGATPVFADVDPRTLNLDPLAAEKAVTKKTKALLPVHLYGQPVELDAFRDLAERKKLHLVEDAAQAAGSLYRGKKAGSFGAISCLSFYPGKNLGAYGDAGGCAVDDPALAKTLRRLRGHGSEVKNRHEILSGNFRLEAFQGAILSVKLPHLDGWNAARRERAARYRELLADAPVKIVEELPRCRSNYHLFVARHPRRDALLAALREQGIMADIHYPMACQLQPAMGKWRGKPGQFPIAEKAIAEIVSLPMYAELTDAQQKRVADAVKKFGA